MTAWLISNEKPPKGYLEYLPEGVRSCCCILCDPIKLQHNMKRKRYKEKRKRKEKKGRELLCWIYFPVGFYFIEYFKHTPLVAAGTIDLE